MIVASEVRVLLPTRQVGATRSLDMGYAVRCPAQPAALCCVQRDGVVCSSFRGHVRKAEASRPPFRDIDHAVSARAGDVNVQLTTTLLLVNPANPCPAK